MQVFLLLALPKCPPCAGIFVFCINLLLVDQTTFGPAFWPSEWLAAFHFRLHGFLDNRCLAFGFGPVFSGCLANFFKIVLSPVRDISDGLPGHHSQQTFRNTLWERVHPRTPAKPVPFTEAVINYKGTRFQRRHSELRRRATARSRDGVIHPY